MGRFDGERVRDLPTTRTIMPFLMRGRNESLVYFEQHVDLTQIQPWLAELKAAGLRASLFHLVLHAAAQTLYERPNLNRFVSGQRIYQRSQVQLSFAAKKGFGRSAVAGQDPESEGVSTVKQTFPQGQSFVDLVRGLDGEIRDAKTLTDRPIDKELAFFTALPRGILSAAVALLRWLDFYNLAPAFLLRPDPMYTSVFVANLGSLGLDAGFHHLYEYGTASLFCVIGRTHLAPAVVDGQVVARPHAVLRWTLDERIEDGLYCARALELFRAKLEDPRAWLGEPADVVQRS
jgi:hypothetical protein